jgi:hypothetical protein
MDLTPVIIKAEGGGGYTFSKMLFVDYFYKIEISSASCSKIVPTYAVIWAEILCVVD